MINQPCPAGRPSGGLGHVGLERSFIDESKSCQHVTHERLTAVDPDIARACDIRPLVLDGAKVFFCVSGQERADAAKPRRGAP